MIKQESTLLLTQIEFPPLIVGSPPNEFVIIVFCYEKASWIGGRASAIFDQNIY